MSLFKRGSVWWAYVMMDGVRHAKSTGTSNRKLAEQISRQFHDELNMKRFGTNQLAPEMSFGELAARFLAEGSPKPYHIDRLKMALPFWSEIPIGRITKAHARDYRQQRHVEKEKLSDITVNRDLQAIRRILFWGVDEGFLPSNPLSRVPLVRPRGKPRLILSLPEEEKLLAAAAPHLRDIIIASLDTGMRRGEILAQRWEHIDFNRQLVYVSKSKTGGGEGREIPMTARLLQLLVQRRQPEGLVFTFKGQPIAKLKTGWKGAIRRAGIRYLRFHDLRHTFNTRLMEAGVLQEIRKALMGHSSGEQVNDLYTHVDVLQKRQAIQKLQDWTKAQLAEAKREEADAETQPRPDSRSDSAQDRSRTERGETEMRRSHRASSQSRTRCRPRRIGRIG